MSKDKIEKLFNALSPEEQDELLVILHGIKKPYSINTTIISEFAAKHQKEYQADVSFTIESLDNKTIKATMQTIFGNFKGVGTNQKIAKINAVKAAIASWE